MADIIEKVPADVRNRIMNILLNTSNIYTREGEETIVVETYVAQEIWAELNTRARNAEPVAAPQAETAPDVVGLVRIIEQSETVDGGYALTLQLDDRDTTVIARFDGRQPVQADEAESSAWHLGCR